MKRGFLGGQNVFWGVKIGYLGSKLELWGQNSDFGGQNWGFWSEIGGLGPTLKVLGVKIGLFGVWTVGFSAGNGWALGSGGIWG